MHQSTLDAVRSSTVIGDGVDWLTLTAKSEEKAATLWNLGRCLCAAGESKGEPSAGWHAHGYRGLSGKHVAFGARPDGVYLRLSGPESLKHWREALTTAENCSRIDLAVDTQFDPPMPSFVHQLYVQSVHRSVHGGRPPLRRLVTDTAGGATCYFGSRSSELFARVYDKGVESGTQPKGRWFRWETEAKDSWARAHSEVLLAAENSSPVVRTQVAAFFRRRSGVELPVSGGAEINNLGQEVTTDAKLLHWLSVGVRPTVQRLVRLYGSERILNALGLPPNSAVHRAEPTQAPREGERCQQ
jgi:hypothetical protein